MTGEFMKEKETIYESARTAAEDEIRIAQLETEEVGGLLRKGDKRQRDLERTIQRLQWDVDKVTEALAASTAEADEVSPQYPSISSLPSCTPSNTP